MVLFDNSIYISNGRSYIFENTSRLFHQFIYYAFLFISEHNIVLSAAKKDNTVFSYDDLMKDDSNKKYILFDDRVEILYHYNTKFEKAEPYYFGPNNLLIRDDLIFEPYSIVDKI